MDNLNWTDTSTAMTEVFDLMNSLNKRNVNMTERYVSHLTNKVQKLVQRKADQKIEINRHKQECAKLATDNNKLTESVEEMKQNVNSYAVTVQNLQMVVQVKDTRIEELEAALREIKNRRGKTVQKRKQAAKKGGEDGEQTDPYETITDGENCDTEIKGYTPTLQ